MATRILNLFCSRCDALVVQYRKQGTGSLVRLYLDRILGPQPLAELKSCGKKSELPPLTCTGCDRKIGIAAVHEGNRLAYRLIKGTFRRREPG